MSEEVAMPVVEQAPVTKALTAQPRQAIEVSERGILLRSFEDLQRFAKMVLEAGAAPKSINTVGMVATAIQMGMERGLAPLAGLRAVYFVNGLPSWRGEAAIAMVRQSPLCRYYKSFVEGEGDARMGVCITWRRGDEESVRTEFTVRDAKKANLWNKGGPWQEYPDRQLKWRAIGFNLKDQFPDILGGFPIAEEAIDWPKDATPAAAERPTLTLVAPPATPDPLLAQLVTQAKPTEASRFDQEAPGRLTVGPPRQVEVVTAKKQTVLPIDCAHKSCPPSKLAALAPGKSLVCSDCGEELSVLREPGQEG